jgi:hypothetical protein
MSGYGTGHHLRMHAMYLMLLLRYDESDKAANAIDVFFTFRKINFGLCGGQLLNTSQTNSLF